MKEPINSIPEAWHLLKRWPGTFIEFDGSVVQCMAPYLYETLELCYVSSILYGI